MRVVPAEYGHYSELLPLLRLLGPKNDWRPLFRKYWKSGEDHFGHVLLDGERPVGYLGLVTSERTIGGQIFRFCNTTSWVVLPEYRNKSLMLLAPLLRMTGHEITNLSASADVCRIFQTLGYRRLDEAFYIVPPLGPSARSRDYSLVTGCETVLPLLAAEEQQMLRDHASTRCEHALFRAAGEQCYLVGSRVCKRGIPFLRLHRIGKPALFEAWLGTLRWELCRAFRVAGLLIDSRFLPSGQPALSLRRPLPTQRLFKSARLVAAEIDNLYSEYAVLSI
jgi:hypothetical protein